MADFAFTRQDETLIASETTKTVPLTCHGHSRPITQISFSSSLSPTNPSTAPQYYMISACKDNNPMLRDGVTGDWIGTFIGHKGAVWSTQLSSDATLAATGSADFSARVWDTFTGATLHTLQHEHIVRAVAFEPVEKPRRLATGGMEKRLRIFDLGVVGSSSTVNGGGQEGGAENGGGSGTGGEESSSSHEIGAGEHNGAIKGIVWGRDPNVIVTAADDRIVRWWDVRARTKTAAYELEAPPTAMVLSVSGDGDEASPSTTTGGVLSVAAGKHVYLFDGDVPGRLQQHIRTERDVASVAVHAKARRMVTGSPSDTWVHVWDLNTQPPRELETGKGHHGPVWTTAFSPDGRLYATGSEDGTVKLWKFAVGPYGLWR